MKMPKMRSLAMTAGVVPLAAAVLAGCAPTSAPQAGLLGQTVVLAKDKSFALMLGTYRCSGGAGPQGSGLPIMWVSVKQSNKSFDDALTGGGSSSVSDAWYDSHTPVTCDGKWHNQVFKLDRHTNLGTLSTNINGWLQFCLTDRAGHLATNDQWVNFQ
jgi:hypothetical protein